MHSKYPKRLNVVHLVVNTIIAQKEHLYCNHYIIEDCTLTLPDDADLEGGEITYVKAVITAGNPQVLPGAGTTIEGGASYVFATSLDSIALCYDKINTNWFISNGLVEPASGGKELAPTFVVGSADAGDTIADCDFLHQNGVTDALQQAVAALNASARGGFIYVRRGTYQTNNEIIPNYPTHIKGEGIQKTFIEITAAVKSTAVFVASDNCSFSDFSFLMAENGTYANLIRATDSSNIHFENIEIVGNTGVTFNKGIFYFFGGSNISFYNVLCNQNDLMTGSFKFFYTEPSSFRFTDGFYFSNCKIKGGSESIFEYCDGGNLFIDECDIVQRNVSPQAGHAVYVRHTQPSLPNENYVISRSRLTLSCKTTALPYCGIWFSPYTNSGIMKKIRVVDNSILLFGYMIRLAHLGAGTTSFEDVEIRDNAVSTAPLASWAFSPSSTVAVFSNCKSFIFSKNLIDTLDISFLAATDMYVCQFLSCQFLNVSNNVLKATGSNINYWRGIGLYSGSDIICESNQIEVLSGGLQCWGIVVPSGGATGERTVIAKNVLNLNGNDAASPTRGIHLYLNGAKNVVCSANAVFSKNTGAGGCYGLHISNPTTTSIATITGNSIEINGASGVERYCIRATTNTVTIGLLVANSLIANGATQLDANATAAFNLNANNHLA